MSRTTRLSLIAVMLLATTALGIMGWNAMHPAQPEPELRIRPQPVEIPEPKEPKPNPYYQKLQADLEHHEKHCLMLSKQSTIVYSSQNHPAQQQVTECWNLVKIEKEYVTNYPNKTIQ